MKNTFFAINKNNNTACLLFGFSCWEAVQGAFRVGILMPDSESATGIGRCASVQEFSNRAKGGEWKVLAYNSGEVLRIAGNLKDIAMEDGLSFVSRLSELKTVEGFKENMPLLRGHFINLGQMAQAIIEADNERQNRTRAVLTAAAMALQSWGEYGEQMKSIGRGADCSFTKTGFNNDALVALVKELI